MCNFSTLSEKFFWIYRLESVFSSLFYLINSVFSIVTLLQFCNHLRFHNIDEVLLLLETFVGHLDVLVEEAELLNVQVTVFSVFFKPLLLFNQTKNMFLFLFLELFLHLFLLGIVNTLFLAVTFAL